MRLTTPMVLLSVLLAVAGCGPSAEKAGENRVVFARGGVVLPGPASAGTFAVVTIDNATVRLADPQPMAGGAFFRWAWKPGDNCTVELHPSGGAAAFRQRAWAPMRPEAGVVAAVTLEKVHEGSITAGGEPDAAVAFSQDGTLLALGTFGGYLRVFNTTSGACVFEKRFPSAVVKRAAISADNLRVYAGEMSYDGFVSAWDLASTKELWRFRLADELGVSKPARPDDFFGLYSYPQAYCLRAVGADLIVDGFHSWNADGKPKHLSRMYRFDGATGAVRWKFPADAPLPRNITWFDVDAKTIALSAYQWERPAEGDSLPQAALSVLDIANGKLRHSRSFEPLKPFFDVVPMWYGLAYDGQGNLALGFMDGRAHLFSIQHEDVAGADMSAFKMTRNLDLASPIEVTGVPVYAGVGWAAGAAGRLFLLTDGRLVAPSASAQGKTIRADHPNSNTLFTFDGATGKLLWQWKLTTTAQSVAAGGNVVAVATQQSYSSDDPMDYGVTVFDASASGTPVEKMLFRYNTAGPIVALAVSPDGSRIAAVEAPVRLADGMIVVGKYRLHIIR